MIVLSIGGGLASLTGLVVSWRWLRVKAGDSAHSWIIEKVTKDQPGGSGYGARMPYAAPNLCQPTVDTLSAWISAGALNN